MEGIDLRLRNFERPRVLVVEDYVDCALLLKSVFETENFFVRTASSCGAARAIRTLVDLYILDYHLPDGNGLDLIREIRQRDSHVPIIFLSAEADMSIHREAREAGAQHCFEKPADVFMLLSLAKQLTTTARIRGFEAVIEERRAILEELSDRATAVSDRLDSAKHRIARILTRRAGRQAFLRAGGTLADFSRFWRAA